MKFKLIPILVLSLLLMPFVANGKESTHNLEKPLYFYDFTTWNANNTKRIGKEEFNNWGKMKDEWFKEYEKHEFREINTNQYTSITNVTGLCSNYVFSVKDLYVDVRKTNRKYINIVLDLEIEDKSLNLYTTNLIESSTKNIDGKTINIKQLYYNVIISNITFNVLSEREESPSTDEIYAFNIPNDIKLVNLDGGDFNTLTNLYSETKFVCTDQDYEISINSNSNYITNNSPVYVNGEVVGNFSDDAIKWKSKLLKAGEYIQIKEISFLPLSSVTNAWEKSEKGLVRESISNFVANASNINSNFYNSVTNYFETNKATLLPKVSITKKCKQPVKVQIGDEVFDLNRPTTTNIVNSFLFDKESVQIKYWVTNSCPDSKCPITTNVFKQTFNKYNRDDYVLTLENIPLQKDVSYVSITNIPENAKVKFNGKKLSPTDGSITISTNSHTSCSFVITQEYYAPLTNQFISGCINSTTTNACPELTPLPWQTCSITNTSLEHSCKVIISYSNITNDVLIAPNSSSNYWLKGQSINNSIDVTFSWNTNSITKTFTRGEDNLITINVQGEKEDPVARFQDVLNDKAKRVQINRFCTNVELAVDSNNYLSKTNVIEAFTLEKGIFKDYTNLVDVTNIITQARYKTGNNCFNELLDKKNGQISTNYFKVITNAFYQAHPEKNKKENKYEK